ncbi:hypothetical protein [Paenibacillus sp. NEAU-GSW1]|uniref:hypothetical protein n=1 Tax=Paenibacillus sp. NEAU-GSW1 TaxID=2682486 RepID=UPI0012E189DD|nr:hypothetical protein [Paenibacillus sp. NEAU-GSW1]MUT66451.1 hypothetical protein [Paenibacillus sp. NEAU-GSW1]
MTERRTLLQLLAPVRSRITMFTVSRNALLGFLAGSFAGLLLLAVSRLFPLLHARFFALLFAAAGLLAGLAYGYWKRATLSDAAKAMDRSGTDDAILTALDGLSHPLDAEPVIVSLQREDAVVSARAYTESLRERLPWPSWRKWRLLVYALGAVWTLTALLLFWPNPLDEKAEARAAAARELERLEEQMEELKQELEAAKLPSEAAEPIKETLEELRNKLAQENDSAAALEELAEAIKKLEQTADAAKQAAERLDEASEAMESEPGLRQLGNALQNRNAAEAAKAISDMRNELTRLTAEQRKAIAEALERIAMEQPEEASELAEALKKAAEQARNGNSGGSEGSANDGLSELQQALEQELSQAQLEAIARSMAEQLSQSGQALAQGAAAQGGGVPSSWSEATSGASGSSSGSNGSSSGEPGGAENGAQGNGGGTGQGQQSGGGSGSGSGSGKGNGGNGNGNGTGGGVQGGLTGGTGVGGRGLITTPRDLQGSGNVQQDGGPSTGGQTQTSEDPSPMIDGMTRPYEEVYSEYAAEAKDALSRSQLPQSMQDKVKQYFDQIQPNR